MIGSPKLAWSACILVALLIEAVAGVKPSLGQADTAGRLRDAARIPSASLLRRLAAAADDYRSGESVYIIAAFEPPHTVKGVFPDSARAGRALGEAGRGYGVFGPFRSLPDFGRSMTFVARPRCLGTIWPCHPVSPWRLPSPPWLLQDIDSIVITAHHRSGRIWRGAGRTMEIDAVFFTLPVIDKFVLPYYAALNGPEYAARLRDSIVTYIRGGNSPD